MSTVEFALLAPVLCFVLLATLDLGFALSERISMDHVLRSGAQVAMEDPGVADVEAVLEATAARNFETAPSAGTEISMGQSPIDILVSRFCACPEAPEAAVACNTTCTGTVPTYIYYRMSATKDFSGVLFQRLPLDASAQLQVR